MGIRVYNLLNFSKSYALGKLPDGYDFLVVVFLGDLWWRDFCRQADLQLCIETGFRRVSR